MLSPPLLRLILPLLLHLLLRLCFAASSIFLVGHPLPALTNSKLKASHTTNTALYASIPCNDLASITCSRVSHLHCQSSTLTKQVRPDGHFCCSLCRKRTWSTIPPSEVESVTEKRIFVLVSHLKHSPGDVKRIQWSDDGSLGHDQNLLYQMGAAVSEEKQDAEEITSPEIKDDRKPDLQVIDVGKELDSDAPVGRTSATQGRAWISSRRPFLA